VKNVKVPSGQLVFYSHVKKVEVPSLDKIQRPRAGSRHHGPDVNYVFFLVSLLVVSHNQSQLANPIDGGQLSQLTCYDRDGSGKAVLNIASTCQQWHFSAAVPNTSVARQRIDPVPDHHGDSSVWLNFSNVQI
jgi:hypothetical protein